MSIHSFIHSFNRKQQSGYGDVIWIVHNSIKQPSVVYWILPQGGTVGQRNSGEARAVYSAALTWVASLRLTWTLPFFLNHTAYCEQSTLSSCTWFPAIIFILFILVKGQKCKEGWWQLLSVTHPSCTSHLNACFLWLPLPVIGWHLLSAGLFCPTADLHRSVGKTESVCWKVSQLLQLLFPSVH